MIRKFLGLLFLLSAASVSVSAQQQQTAQPQATPQTQSGPQPAAPAPPKTHLKVGDPAPDFTLMDTERKQVKLSDFKGKKNVVLAFYVLAFTGG